MLPLKAIAAMSENRVIGSNNSIPWHLPEDFKWFKQTTTGHVLVMGRKTFESIGKPLPNRETIVVSRSGFSFPGVRTISSLSELEPAVGEKQAFICGGAEIYRQALPLCAELYLTRVKRVVQGDTFFPSFEDEFEQVSLIKDTAEFQVEHWRNRRFTHAG